VHHLIEGPIFKKKGKERKQKEEKKEILDMHH
jgi:hypothetical protein